MLQTVKATVDTNGTVHLSEPLRVEKPMRAIVTLLEETDLEELEKPGNAAKVLKFLQTNRLPAEARPTAEEMEAQIEENRNSWD